MSIDAKGERFSRDQLISLAEDGKLTVTFTARHGAKADYKHPQPALWTMGPMHAQRGKQEFPVLAGESKTMTISGQHLQKDANVIINGRKADATITLGNNDRVEIALQSLPTPGIHFLQVQNPDGLFSNDFIFHVAANEAAARKLRSAGNPNRHRRALGEAIFRGDVVEANRLIRDGATLDGHHPDSGSTPLMDAAFHGEKEILTLLLESGARVSHTSRDGNTPLHTAAFLCRTESVRLLLERGASLEKRNHRRETPIDVVSSDWSEPLVRFYGVLDKAGNLNLDMERIRKTRPEIAKLLRNHAMKSH